MSTLKKMTEAMYADRETLVNDKSIALTALGVLALRSPSDGVVQAASMALSALYRGDGGWIGGEAAKEQVLITHRAIVDAILQGK